MAPFLGAAGAFVGVLLVFLPRADSPELAYIKEQFRLVNNKLNTITHKLSDIDTDRVRVTMFFIYCNGRCHQFWVRANQYCSAIPQQFQRRRIFK